MMTEKFINLLNDTVEKQKELKGLRDKGAKVERETFLALTSDIQSFFLDWASKASTDKSHLMGEEVFTDEKNVNPFWEAGSVVKEGTNAHKYYTITRDSNTVDTFAAELSYCPVPTNVSYLTFYQVGEKFAIQLKEEYAEDIDVIRKVIQRFCNVTYLGIPVTELDFADYDRATALVTRLYEDKEGLKDNSYYEDILKQIQYTYENMNKHYSESIEKEKPVVTPDVEVKTGESTTPEKETDNKKPYYNPRLVDNIDDPLPEESATYPEGEPQPYLDPSLVDDIDTPLPGETVGKYDPSLTPSIDEAKSSEILKNPEGVDPSLVDNIDDPLPGETVGSFVSNNDKTTPSKEEIAKKVTEKMDEYGLVDDIDKPLPEGFVPPKN